jgi:hypothetical protein
MSIETRVAWIGIIPKLIWPAAAVAALIMFRQPIYDAIQGAANSGATVEVAGVKILLAKGEFKETTPPPESIRAVLVQLDRPLIEHILNNFGGTLRVDTCYHARNPDEFEPNSVKSRLKALGLINFDKEEWSQNGQPCEAGSKTTYTPLYDEVRRYLIDLLSATRFTGH